jgi:hypothetical protein
MYSMWIRVEYEGMAVLLAPGLSRTGRVMGGFRAEANKRGVLHWHKNMLPRHFTASNARYNYQPRKQKYLEIKREIGQTGRAFVNGQLIRESVAKGGVVDVVRSGVTEVMMRADSPVTTSANRATLRMEAPAAVAARPRGDRPDMSREITITTPGERDEIRTVWMQEFNRQLVGYNQNLSQRI